jgi:pimeloyl-ACP methyl ester carboxylesterase
MLLEKRITVDDLAVQLYTAGEGHPRTLLLLHGGVGDAFLHWTPAAPFLAEEYHVIAPNLPGYGESAPLRETTFAALIRWLKAILDVLKVEQAVVIGNSFSGLVARLFAAEYAQNVPALILVNGGTVPRSIPPMARLLARLPVIGDMVFNSGSRSMLTPKELGWLLNDPAGLTDEFLARAKANATGLAWTMRVSSISPIPEQRTPPLPTLLVWGADDPILPQQDALRLQAELPGAQIALIESTKHSPHLDEPDVFAFQVTQFLDHLNRSSAAGLRGVGKLGEG